MTKTLPSKNGTVGDEKKMADSEKVSKWGEPTTPKNEQPQGKSKWGRTAPPKEEAPQDVTIHSTLNTHQQQ